MKPTSGTIIQLEREKPRNRCRKWELRANFGKVDGKYPKKTRRFNGTWREANIALREWLVELEFEDDFEKSPTFSAYSRRWIASRAESGTLSEATLSSDSTRVNAATRIIGEKLMMDITHDDITGLYASLMNGDSPSGRKWSPKSIEGLHKTLTKLFKDAVRDAVIESEPISGVRCPHVPQAVRKVPTCDEIDAMAASLKPDDPMQMGVMLCAYLGLRREEACALRWDDYDGERVRVCRAVSVSGSEKPTKTGKVRYVPVPKNLRSILDTMKGHGKMCDVQPMSLTRWWSRHRCSFGMDGVRLHDLRHAYATRLAESGVHPRVMMQLGGWDSIDVCMNIYTHVNYDEMSVAVERAFR